MKEQTKRSVRGFEEIITFGQGSHGTRCRVCLQDDYLSRLTHRWWCPARWIRRLR